MNTSTNPPLTAPDTTWYVDALRFQVKTMGSGSTHWHVFIPTMNLEITDDGDLSKSIIPCTPRKVLEVDDLYYAKCMEENREPDRIELTRLRAEATEEATENVQIPLSLAEDMKALFEEREALKNKQKELNNSIKNLSMQIFPP